MYIEKFHGSSSVASASCGGREDEEKTNFAIAATAAAHQQRERKRWNKTKSETRRIESIILSVRRMSNFLIFMHFSKANQIFGADLSIHAAQYAAIYFDRFSSHTYMHAWMMVGRQTHFIVEHIFMLRMIWFFWYRKTLTFSVEFLCF